ncbi:hypothetical protein M3Y94_00671800 [Aphelenchoides besseyi]|nr:hypothetical protein M3Y94_00671800 [Aphelenchoides besseyi]KAI6231349.1 hypothetical protein M3Y95_00372200 [Aphelenchoides besseyi]
MEHKSTSITCRTCGMNFHSGATKKRHEDTHRKTVGWKCSCCGGLQQSAASRNNHEKCAHNFERLDEDCGFRGAVKMRKDQLPQLFNIGFLLDEVQKTACKSVAPTNDPEATEEELNEIMNKNPQRPPIHSSCSFCGMKNFWAKSTLDLHFAKHNLLDGFTCSLCGIKEERAYQRNLHEKNSHNFSRNSHTKSKEAVQISEEVLKSCRQVGTNFADVQRSALPTTSTNEHSALNPEPVQRPTKRSSSASIELVTLDSSDDESQPTISVHRPLQVVEPLDHSAHLSRSSKQVRLVEEITLDDSDDDLLPEPTIQTPRPNIRASHFAFQTPQPTNSTSQFTTPTPRSRSFASAPQPTTQNRSRANDLMTEMFKKPQVVYYDYKAVGYELSVLPISIWKNCADCELLILRSDSADWKGTIELGDPFCRFHLNEAIGYFLGFAKPSSQLLANRFKGRLSNLTSFNQLIEGMHGMDFRSTLIISNEINRASIDSLSSQRFVFL